MSNYTATFIDYNIDQLVLPMDYSDLIPEDHVVRVIHEMVELVNDDLFFSRYQGGGRSSYHPKMMTKVILYAYTQKLYSCRDIAKALLENLPTVTKKNFRKTYNTSLNASKKPSN